MKPSSSWILVLALIVACKAPKKIADESQEWRIYIQEAEKRLHAQIVETRDAAAQAAEAAIRAVPGERYLQLIDDVHGDDPKKAEEARRFLESLFGVSPDVEYEVSVYFEFEPDHPVRADILRASSPAPEHVSTYVDPRLGNSLNPTAVGVSQLRPLTDSELERQIDLAVDGFLRELVGEPQQAAGELRPITGHGEYADVIAYGNIVNGRVRELIGADHVMAEDLFGPVPREWPKRRHLWARVNWPNALWTERRWSDECYRHRCGGTPDLKHEALAQRSGAKDQLRSALMAVLASRRNIDVGTPLKKRWDPFDGRAYLFVLIAKEDFDYYRDKPACKEGGLCIRALVHKAGDPSLPLQDLRPYSFSLGEFDLPNAIKHPVHGEWLWASHRMDDNWMLSQSALDTQKELARVIEELREPLPPPNQRDF